MLDNDIINELVVALDNVKNDNNNIIIVKKLCKNIFFPNNKFSPNISAVKVLRSHNIDIYIHKVEESESYRMYCIYNDFCVSIGTLSKTDLIK